MTTYPMFNINFSGKWRHCGCAYARGFAFFDGGELLNSCRLAEFFAECHDEHAFAAALEKCNGMFSVVVCNPDFRAAAIDGTRLYPVFFKVQAQTVSLADDPYCLLDSDSALDADSKAIYDASAAALSGTTLVGNVRQLPAFCYAVFSNGGEVVLKSYYDYLTQKTDEVERSCEEMMKALDNAFGRLKQYVGNRQVVVPLSGGYDSRTIVCMLKKHGFSDVLCYTVSRDGTKELDDARRVAERLGVRFLQINNKDVSASFLSDPQFDRYVRHLGCLTNFVWLFEYFAIIKMRSLGVLRSDAVFMPGHSGDFLGGSLLTKMNVGENCSDEAIARNLLLNHFEYNFGQKAQQIVTCRISAMRGATSYSKAQQFIFENKLPMQINNSARVYDFFGYEAVLPFWDMELLDFFKTASREQLYQKRLYNETLNSMLFAQFGVEMADTDFVPDEVLSWQRLKNRLKHYIPRLVLSANAKFDDVVGEAELAAMMLAQLTQDKNPLSAFVCRHSYTSSNEIIKDWYLMKVSQALAQAKKK